MTEALGGRYGVVRELARGGMGRVLLARDPRLNRELAVKTLLAADAEAAQLRFVEEAQITGQLAHPNVIPIHELGRVGDELYLAMKLVRGRDLHAVVRALADGDPKTERAFPLQRLLRLFLKICDAMAYAHERGVIHRDLKPANVMLGDGDEVLVMDWGLARPVDARGVSEQSEETVTSAARASDAAGSGELTQEGAVVGTPAYMPPEQADGEPLDVRADVYALGAILYELLALRAPYSGSALQVLTHLTQGPPPRPSQVAGAREVPPALEAVVACAMARKRRDRYPDAAALAADVEAYLDGRAVSVYREGFVEGLGRLLRRHRLKVASASVAALLLGVAGGAASLVVDRQRAAAAAEQRAADEAHQRAERADAAAAAAQRYVAVARSAAALVARTVGQIGAWKRLVGGTFGAKAAGAEADRLLTERRAVVEGDGERDGLLALSDEVAEAIATAEREGVDAAPLVRLREGAEAARRSLDRTVADALLAWDPWTLDGLVAELDLGQAVGLIRARIALRTWQPDEALKQAASAPDDPPRIAAAKAALRASLERRPAAEQEQAFTRAVELDPEASWLRFRRAEVWSRLGRLDEAEAEYDRARRLTPGDGWALLSRLTHVVPVFAPGDLVRRKYLRRRLIAPPVRKLIRAREALGSEWCGIWRARPGAFEQRWTQHAAEFQQLHDDLQRDGRAPAELVWGFAARAALEIGRTEQAAAWGEQLAKERPDDPDALGLLAEVRLVQGADDAEELARRALARDGEHGQSAYVLGELLRRRGDPAGARPFLELGARGSLRSERWLRLAECLGALTDVSAWAEGVRAGRRALELDPADELANPSLRFGKSDPALHRVLGALRARQGNHAAAALQFVRAALLALSKGEPAGPDLVRAGDAHRALGLPVEAAELYGVAVKQDPGVRADAAARLDALRREVGRRGPALPDLPAPAAPTAPADEPAAETLARAQRLAREGKHADAAAAFGVVLKADPGNAEARLGRARSALAAGDLGTALTDTTKLLEERPEDADLFVLRAQVYLKAGRTVDARSDLNSAVDCRPDDPKVYVRRAALRLRMRQLEPALEDLNQAIRRGSRSGAVYFQRGELLARKGDWARALADFEEAGRLGVPSELAPVLKDRLAKAQAALGN